MNQTLVTRSQVFYIAWPIILSNISTPLLGLVDTAVIGNLGDPALIGAIAIGSMLFSFLYWGFGFLRMGTTGLVAQARGAGDEAEAKAAFYRAFLVGVFIGLLLFLLQTPISSLAFSVIDGSSQVEASAAIYFQIRIWGAPLSLSYLAIMGYLLGQQDTRSILILQLLLNFTNIILDLVFVIGFGFDVAGIAAATVIAECLALIAGLGIVIHRIKKQHLGLHVPLKQLKDTPALKRMFVINRDIMIRTLCLIFAFAWFTNEGAKSGDILLATNAILLQFVTFSAFFLDGFALAAESLVGNAIGAKNREQIKVAIKYAAQLGFTTALLVSVSFILAGGMVINVLTNIIEVREVAKIYFPWVVAAPIVSVWCYLLDGVFIGATKTREMRNAMIISLLTYMLAWWVLAGLYGNHGLWASLMLYFITRAVTLNYYLPQLINDSGVKT
ncbi:MAG: MATE family efflux transporter [Gammaproteobacteria bacterium]|nr:MATE family efflux transporter [Gammaproteobacteria bacterium]